MKIIDLKEITEEINYLSTKVNCEKRDNLIDKQACKLAKLNNKLGDILNPKIIMLIMEVDDHDVRRRLFDTFIKEGRHNGNR